MARALLKSVRKEIFSVADFDLQSDWVVRLNPELARSLSGQALLLMRAFITASELF